MVCNKCGMEHDQATCPHCGVITDVEVKEEAATDVVPNADLSEAGVTKEVVPEAVAPKENSADTRLDELYKEEQVEPPKKRKNQNLMMAIVAAAALLIVVIGIFSIPRDTTVNRENHPIVYIKDDKLFMLPVGKSESVLLTATYGEKASATISNNGKRVFFGDSHYEDSFTLYYRDANNTRMKNADDKGVKVSEGVKDFAIEQVGGRKVAYLKNGNLYLNDLREPELEIKTDVVQFRLSDDGSNLIYQDNTGVLYLRPAKYRAKEAEIGTNVLRLIYISPNCDRVIYLANEKELYIKDKNKEAVLVSDEAVSAYYLSDKLYVMKVEERYTYSVNKYENGELIMIDGGLSSSSLNFTNSEDIQGFCYVKYNEETGMRNLYIMKDGYEPFHAIELDNNSYNYEVTADMQYFYIIENAVNMAGSLNRYRIEDNSLISMGMIAENISFFKINDNGRLIQLISKVDDRYEMFTFENEKLSLAAERTTLAGGTYIDGVVYFIDNVDQATRKGELNIWSNGKKVGIDKEVSVYDARSDGYIVYLRNANDTTGLGELWYYKNGETAMVDTEVSVFLNR